MNRRQFFNWLGILASMPLIGKLLPKQQNYECHIGTNINHDKLSYEFMEELVKYAQEHKILPLTDESGRDYYWLQTPTKSVKIDARLLLR